MTDVFPTSGPWVDTHCHLFLGESSAGDRLDDAVAVGVDWVMCPGVDLESTLAARAIAERHPSRVRWSAGLHPHDAEHWPEVEGRLRSLALDAHAIGECGLDYYRNLSSPDAQRVAFQAQLELASELGKPVIIHCRDAFADVHDALEAAQLGERAVLHCWTGGPRWTRRFADLGVTFSFAGPVTFPTGETVRLGAAEAPPDRTMVETDAPYLTPTPHRGEENRPALVPLVGAALAEVWGIDVGEVAAATTTTAERVLGRPT